MPSLGFSVPRRTARIVDSGDEPVTCSTGKAIGIAAAGILLHVEETANRFLKVRSVKFTQNQCLAALEEATDSKWHVSRISTPELRVSKAEKDEEKRFQEAFLDVLAMQLFEDGTGRGLITPHENDNDLLGVREENVVDMMRKLVADK